MGVRGIEASFKVDSSSDVLTDVSTYLNNIGKSSDVERIDYTTFQPNVASPLKAETSGFRTRGYTLTGIYTKAADDFFAAIEGLEGLNYEYGPEGTTSGKQKIAGLCNCLNYSGPQAAVTGVKTFTVELAVTSEARTTY